MIYCRYYIALKRNDIIEVVNVVNKIREYEGRMGRFVSGIPKCRICGSIDVDVDGIAYHCKCGFMGVLSENTI